MTSQIKDASPPSWVALMFLIALRRKLKYITYSVQLLNTGTGDGDSELSLQNDKDRYKEILSPATIKLP